MKPTEEKDDSDEQQIAVFSCPRRPNIGREGRPISLRANHFQITMPRGFVHHYDINIQPDKCPRKVNREIIETMVHAYSKIFGTLKPVFDGRNNLYTRDPLPIGNDRIELEVRLWKLFFQAILNDFISIFAGHPPWRRQGQSIPSRYQVGRSGISIRTRGGPRGTHQTDSIRRYSSPGRCNAAFTLYDVYSGGKIILQQPGWVLSSFGRRQGSLVRISSVRKAFAVENDA